MTGELSPQEAAAQLEQGALALLDVREDWEIETARVGGALHIPLGSLPARVDELDPGQPLAVLCHHGVRSAMAAQFLAQRGFETYNVTGGIDAWSLQVDTSVPRY